MSLKRKIILISFLNEIFTLVSGYIITIKFSSTWTPLNFVPEMTTLDIFLNNISTIGLYSLTALLGPVGLILSLSTVFGVGVGIARVVYFYNMSLKSFFVTFLPHAIGEMLALGLVIFWSTDISIFWISYFRNKNKKNPMAFYRSEIPHIVNTFILILPILLLSAYVETSFSRKYFLNLIGGK